MSRYGVSPNMLVLPPQMLLYMALAPEQKLTYKEGGPAAEARFEAGVAGFEARSFRGCGVFTSGAQTRAPCTISPFGFSRRSPAPLAACAQSPSRSRTVRHTTPRRPCDLVRLSPRLRACADADSVQMLTRSSQIGECTFRRRSNPGPFACAAARA